MNILKSINDVVNKQNFDFATKKEIEKANELNKRANIVSTGQIQMRTITAKASTKVNEPISQQRAKNLIEELGVKYMDGLSANFVYPLINGNNSQWMNETEEVQENDIEFNSIKLMPKRLASYVEYSRDDVLNPSVGIEKAVHEDLINSVFDKVQSTILNDIYDSNNTMIINNYNDIVEFEYSAATQNISNGVYVVSPLAAKALKKMLNGNTPIYNDGKINGTQVYETPSLKGNKILFGDFSKLLLGQFGALDITCDHVTKAKDGIIKVIVNSFWDWGKIDNNAFVFGNIVNE